MVTEVGKSHRLIEYQSGSYKRCKQKYMVFISYPKLKINIWMFMSGWKWYRGIKMVPSLPLPSNESFVSAKERVMKILN